jgi:hypothetical protein
MLDTDSQKHYLTDELHRVMAKFVEERGLTVGEVVGVAKKAANSFFEQVSLRQNELLIERISRGEFPPADSPAWVTPDGSGWTPAHYAAGRSGLPEGFDQWDAADRNGWTVAHEAAAYGKLPEGFKEWQMIDHKGKRVIDVAIEYGFDPFANVRELLALAKSGELLSTNGWAWDMADDEGWTLAHEHAAAGL